MIYINPESDGGFPRDESVVNNLKYSEEQIMKNMNKQRGFGDSIFFIFIIGIVILFIAASSDEKKDQEAEVDPVSLMSTREAKVIEIYGEATTDLGSWPTHVKNDLIEVASRRVSKAQKGFFCDARDAVTAGEYKVRRFNESRSVQGKNGSLKTLPEIYQDIYGETVEQSCGIIVIGGKKAKPETPKGFVESQEVVRGNKLTPEMYDKMIQSANYCARSKQFMMNVTKDKGLLTTEDYDGLMDAVLECKRFELEQTLQQG